LAVFCLSFFGGVARLGEARLLVLLVGQIQSWLFEQMWGLLFKRLAVSDGVSVLNHFS
jgi:hypothetical protein